MMHHFYRLLLNANGGNRFFIHAEFRVTVGRRSEAWRNRLEGAQESGSAAAAQAPADAPLKRQAPADTDVQKKPKVQRRLKPQPIAGSASVAAKRASAAPNEAAAKKPAATKEPTATAPSDGSTVARTPTPPAPSAVSATRASPTAVASAAEQGEGARSDRIGSDEEDEEDEDEDEDDLTEAKRLHALRQLSNDEKQSLGEQCLAKQDEADRWAAMLEDGGLHEGERGVAEPHPEVSTARINLEQQIVDRLRASQADPPLPDAPPPDSQVFFSHSPILPTRHTPFLCIYRRHFCCSACGARDRRARGGAPRRGRVEGSL